MKTGVILIGMPGVGKSTIGILLAKTLGLDFLDTDVAIQVEAGHSLQHIIDHQGHLALRALEEKVLLQTDARNKVIATGGSAVYSDAAMAHFKNQGTIVYLAASKTLLEKRLHNYATRGIARRPDQSFEDLFTERCTLYSRYADITINCDGQDMDTLVQIIQSKLPRPA